jgi:hypothetical protein
MDATENELNQSFDSSIELDDLSLTETTNSLPPEVARAASLANDPVFESITLTPTKQNNPF